MQDDEGNTLKSQDNRTGLRALPLKSMECASARSPCGQKTGSHLSNRGYPWSDARLSRFLMSAEAGCLSEILQLRPPLEEWHLLQQTPARPTAAVRSPRERQERTLSEAHRKPAAGACAALYR